MTGGFVLQLPIESIEAEPERTLDAWSAYVVPFDGPERAWTCHLTGFRREGCKGQVSSPVVAIDPERRRARTRSGSVYALAGRPGMNPDALATWGQFKKARMLGQQEDVTEQLDAILAQPGD